MRCTHQPAQASSHVLNPWSLHHWCKVGLLAQQGPMKIKVSNAEWLPARVAKLVGAGEELSVNRRSWDWNHHLGRRNWRKEKGQVPGTSLELLDTTGTRGLICVSRWVPCIPILFSETDLSWICVRSHSESHVPADLHEDSLVLCMAIAIAPQSENRPWSWDLGSPCSSATYGPRDPEQIISPVDGRVKWGNPC